MKSPNSDQQITSSLILSRLERKMQIEFSCQVNACVIEKLQRDVNFNKKKAVN